jgi:hypothetical protein
MSTRVAAFWRNHRTIFIRTLLLLVAVFVIFEVGVRLLTPDAVQYDVQVSTNGGPVDTRTGTITDPTTIARWRVAFTKTPSGQLLISTLIRQWEKQITCATLSSFTASYVFLWHGITLEAVSSLPACDEEYQISSGGLPDPRTYFAPQFVQP